MTNIYENIRARAITILESDASPTLRDLALGELAQEYFDSCRINQFIERENRD